MDKTRIEYGDYSWSFLIGCKHKCKKFKCWAENLNKRFGYIPDFNDPQIFMDRVWVPYKKYEKTKPGIVLVCFMGDLFGRWVDKTIISTALEIAGNLPKLTFLFLTHNPFRYLEFTDYLRPNIYFGASMSAPNKKIISTMEKVHKYGKVFYSIEPLLGSFKGVLLESNLVIVGDKWPNKKPFATLGQINSISHFNLFYKENLRKHYPHLPKGDKVKQIQVYKEKSC